MSDERAQSDHADLDDRDFRTSTSVQVAGHLTTWDLATSGIQLVGGNGVLAPKKVTDAIGAVFGLPLDSIMSYIRSLEAYRSEACQLRARVVELEHELEERDERAQSDAFDTDTQD